MSQHYLEALQIIEMFDKENRVLNTQDFADHLDVSASLYIPDRTNSIGHGLPKKSYPKCL